MDGIKLSRPQFDILHSRSDRNLFHTGQGGGKTNVMGLLSHRLIIEFPKNIGLIAANTYQQLSDSTLKEIFLVWSKFGWSEYDKNSNPEGWYVIDKEPPGSFEPHGHTFKTNQNKIFTRNGAVIFTASLDNYKALDGRTIGWAMLDETKDTREEAVKQVIIGRLRERGIFVRKDPENEDFQFTVDPALGEREINPLWIFTSPAKEQWLTEFFNLDEYREEILAHIFSKEDYFYKETPDRTMVIASSYHNARNLPENYITNQIRDLSPEVAEMLVYGNPFGKSGGEYYSAFKKSVHIKSVSYTPDLPIHLSFDFNVNPYMPATVWQVVPGSDGRTKARALCEYALKYPQNTIEDVCRRFNAEYGHLCQPGFFFYGDASGKNTLPLKEQRNYYQVIEDELRHLISGSSRRVLKSNPRHRSIMAGTLGRRDFMNACLNGRYEFDIEIDESCRYLIADLEFMREDANGAKNKVKEEINGVVCEKYGHLSDSMDGFFCYVWGDWKTK